MSSSTSDVSGFTSDDVAEHLSAAQCFFEWCVDQVEAACAQQRFSDALSIAAVAAQAASSAGFFGELAAPRLEAALIRIAAALPVPTHSRRQQGQQGNNRQRWLHVLTLAYPTFGHTKLCRMWIEDHADVTHDVVLLQQRVEIPSNLVQAAANTGGVVTCLDHKQALLALANDLRQHAAANNADVIVLHTHPHDVIAPVAFGVGDGPPVLLVNHADHLFWLGASVVDLVVDIRDSGHRWTREHRGIRNACIVPIPLGAPNEELGLRNSSALDSKQEARNILGLPRDDVILLTIGNSFKYVPIAGLDFLAAARSILSSRHSVLLVAVGPVDTGAWRALKDSTGGRLRAVGNQIDVSVYHRAADLYLEGFPMGSLTALLEAGLTGLPCVRAPSSSRPPMSSDGIAFADLEQPRNLCDYVSLALRFIDDAESRLEVGTKLRDDIRLHHCGSGWLIHLDSMKQQIPKDHEISLDFSTSPIPWESLIRWLSFERVRSGIRNVNHLIENLLFVAMKGGIDSDNLARSTLRGALAVRVNVDFEELVWKARRKALRDIAKQQLWESYTTDKRSTAIRKSLRSLNKDWCSIADPSWRRLAVKAALGPRMTGYLRQFLAAIVNSAHRPPASTPER